MDEIKKLERENLELKKELEKLRKFTEHRKNAMLEKAKKGKLMSRPAFGYKVEKNNLIPAQNADEVREIFKEFLNNSISLSNLSKKHHLSVNGLKKIITNYTYIGKIKFNNQIYNAGHQPLVSSTLFNHVQNKIEKLGLKKPNA